MLPPIHLVGLFFLILQVCFLDRFYEGFKISMSVLAYMLHFLLRILKQCYQEGCVQLYFSSSYNIPYSEYSIKIISPEFDHSLF